VAARLVPVPARNQVSVAGEGQGGQAPVGGERAEGAGRDLRLVLAGLAGHVAGEEGQACQRPHPDDTEGMDQLLLAEHVTDERADRRVKRGFEDPGEQEQRDRRGRRPRDREQSVAERHARGREQQQPPVPETVRERAAGQAGPELPGRQHDEQHARGRSAEPRVAMRPDQDERQHGTAPELTERAHRHQAGAVRAASAPVSRSSTRWTTCRSRSATPR
jgi:hypothetical protein